MTTRDFKTQTHFMKADNPTVDGYWPIALDIGYSSVKGFSRNGIYSFPSFIRKVNEGFSFDGATDRTSIAYRDEVNGVYDVGNVAIMKTNDKEPYGNDDTLYSRTRYSQALFLILARVGMAIGLSANKHATHTDEKVVLQTGLPIEYLKADSDELAEALSGTHKFDIKFANCNEWTHYEINLDKGDIHIMPQPLGSYWSCVFDNAGKVLKGTKDFLSTTAIVFDGGFGTLDTFVTKQGAILGSHTYPEYGMREVFKRTVDKIADTYGEYIPVPYLHKYLEYGTFSTLIPNEGFTKPDIFNPKSYTKEDISFDDIMSNSCEEVFREAIKKVFDSVPDIKEIRWLIVTGGTGTAWYDYIVEMVAPLGIEVINANRNNPNIPSIFNNVRGYYMQLLAYLNQR